MYSDKDYAFFLNVSFYCNLFIEGLLLIADHINALKIINMEIFLAWQFYFEKQGYFHNSQK